MVRLYLTDGRRASWRLKTGESILRDAFDSHAAWKRDIPLQPRSAYPAVVVSYAGEIQYLFELTCKRTLFDGNIPDQDLIPPSIATFSSTLYL